MANQPNAAYTAQHDARAGQPRCRFALRPASPLILKRIQGAKRKREGNQDVSIKGLGIRIIARYTQQPHTEHPEQILPWMMRAAAAFPNAIRKHRKCKSANDSKDRPLWKQLHAHMIQHHRRRSDQFNLVL